MSLTDIVSIASFFISTVAFTQQILAGHTLLGASQGQIIERLILRISENQSLSKAAIERLIRHLIDRIMQGKFSKNSYLPTLAACQPFDLIVA